MSDCGFRCDLRCTDFRLDIELSALGPLGTFAVALSAILAVTAITIPGPAFAAFFALHAVAMAVFWRVRRLRIDGLNFSHIGWLIRPGVRRSLAALTALTAATVATLAPVAPVFTTVTPLTTFGAR